ncbi:hypothetical protein GCM10007887_15850 [Methylobacterium haplocladii]|uniref:M23ase beta-sheet core domain-containing protein n=2 Tax=Methylobacterium haplocladii TaxID=1176176 RepID=A0A512IP55_9HYPH|nr:hypothetical protein MHA02_18300 [Methylobacterium haplocladii]GJD83271.1 hypothetical protein HPGCJGGD_1137 [Methylobacterium haplocladii]GLS58919.1 hypothetical protein GCM10007887_15850 [Methylobacterium haplocladii]
MIGGGTAACSSDASRLGTPFSNPFASNEPSATGSLGDNGEADMAAAPAIRTPRIQSQELAAPGATMSPRSAPSRVAASEPISGAVDGMNPSAGKAMTPRVSPVAPQPKLVFGKGASATPKVDKAAEAKREAAEARKEAEAAKLAEAKKAADARKAAEAKKQAELDAKKAPKHAAKAAEEKHAKAEAKPEKSDKKAEAKREAEAKAAKEAKSEAQKKVAEAKAAEAAAKASAKETKQAAAKETKPVAKEAEKATPVKVASVEPTTTASVKADANESFRWPAKGRVINGYGSSGNEGINIAVPEGTPVKAAEDGTVAYAGSDVKGYGKLVLVRHTNGYVSAYAHNGELDVRPGEKVKRGQTIAKSGATGNVTSPQLHFEIRKGATPVDPIPHLASN